MQYNGNYSDNIELLHELLLLCSMNKESIFLYDCFDSCLLKNTENIEAQKYEFTNTLYYSDMFVLLLIVYFISLYSGFTRVSIGDVVP